MPNGKITDPHHPDFKHGTSTGYRDGCRKDFPCPSLPTCLEVVNADQRDRSARKKAALASGEGWQVRYRPAALARHLKELREGDWTLETLAAEAEISSAHLRRIIRCQATVSRECAERILALDDEVLANGIHGRVPIRMARWMARSLYALGYTPKQLSRRLGVNAHAVVALLRNENRRYVERRVYRNLRILYDDWGSALPPRGGGADEVRADAARRGWYTPEFYTEDGRLMDEVDWDGSRDESYARRTRTARDRLSVLYRTLRYWEASDKVAAVLRIHEDLVARYRVEAGLRFQRPPHGSDNWGNDIELKPGFEARATFVMEVLRRWEADPLADPHIYALELGMMIDKKFRLAPRNRRNALVMAA